MHVHLPLPRARATLESRMCGVEAGHVLAPGAGLMPAFAQSREPTHSSAPTHENGSRDLGILCTRRDVAAEV